MKPTANSQQPTANSRTMSNLSKICIMSNAVENAVQQLVKRKAELSSQMTANPIWKEYQQVEKALKELKVINEITNDPATVKEEQHTRTNGHAVLKTKPLTDTEKTFLGLIKSMGFTAHLSKQIYKRAEQEQGHTVAYASVLINQLRKKGYLSSIKRGTWQLTQIAKSLQNAAHA